MSKRTQEIDNELKRCKEALLNVEGAPCEVYSRIVGYYRNVNNWNPGKKGEYAQRRPFDPNWTDFGRSAS